MIKSACWEAAQIDFHEIERWSSEAVVKVDVLYSSTMEVASLPNMLHGLLKL